MSVVKGLDRDVRIQQGVASIAGAEWPLRVRVGLAAGEPVADGDDLFGLAVNLASRVCNACEPGAVFVTSSVRDLAVGKVTNGTTWASTPSRALTSPCASTACVGRPERYAGDFGGRLNPSHKSGPRHRCRAAASRRYPPVTNATTT